MCGPDDRIIIWEYLGGWMEIEKRKSNMEFLRIVSKFALFYTPHHESGNDRLLLV